MSMSDKVYKLVEIVGTSDESFARAVASGVERASKTLRNLDWFEVTEIRGHLAGGAIDHFSGGLKVGVLLDDA